MKPAITMASRAWYLTLVLIPLVTAGMLFWLRQVEVGLLTGRSIGAYGVVPNFDFTNQDARRFGLQNLKGKIWIADFIYTTCPGPCPMISTRMSELEKPLRKTDVQLVSFSVDPEKDTPAVLHTYADNLHADASRWNFLTSARPLIYSLLRDGFKVGVSDGTEEQGQPVHSTRLVLVDRQGQIRGYYDALEADAITKILADTNHLLRDQPQ